MSTPQRAASISARQTWNSRLDILGFNSAAVQSVSLPKISRDEVVYSDGGSDIKRPGRTKTGDLVVKTLISHGLEDLALLTWMLSTYNPATGVGTPSADMRDGSIVNLDASGREYERWNFTEAWVKEISGYDFDKSKSENFMITVTLSVRTCIPAALGG